MTFGAIVIDKIGEDDDLESIISSEENLFVIGQLQDYLIQEGYDVEFGEVELVSAMGEEYNITSAMSDFSVVLARKPYTRGIRLLMAMTRKQYENQIRLIAVSETSRAFRKSAIIKAIVKIAKAEESHCFGKTY